MKTGPTYSYHDSSHERPGGGPPVEGWEVVAEWADEFGDVCETEALAWYFRESAAAAHVARLLQGLGS